MQASHQGLLFKEPRDGKLGRTTRRWFVLREHALLWYSPVSDSSGAIRAPPRGQIVVSQHTEIDSSTGGQLVVRSYGNHLTLRATAPWYAWNATGVGRDALMQWRQALEAHVERLRVTARPPVGVPVHATAVAVLAPPATPSSTLVATPAAPTTPTTPAAPGPAAPSPKPSASLVDVNAAGVDQLAALPGIGPSKAAAIVAHRERHGRFASVASLEAVPGVGAATVQKLRPLVQLGSAVAPAPIGAPTPASSSVGASSSVAALWERTLSCLERGRDADVRGGAKAEAEARALLGDGVVGLRRLLAIETEPRRRAALQARLDEYGGRLDELQAAAQPTPPRTPLPTTPRPPPSAPPVAYPVCSNADAAPSARALRHQPFFFPDGGGRGMPCAAYLAGSQCAAKGCRLAHRETGVVALLRAISAARCTLDVAVYAIAIDLLADAIVAAHRRGVAVRVLSDDEQEKDPRSVVAALRAARVPLRTDDSRRCHMHHKFVVVDGGALLATGSFNWTSGAAQGNCENLVISRGCAALARRFSDEFERLWKGFGAGEPGRAPPCAAATHGSGGGGDGGGGEEQTAALFFPEAKGGANLALVRAELGAATRSIDVAMFTLTHDGLVEVLLAQHARSRRVRVVCDGRQAHCKGSDVQRLRAAGVPLRCNSSYYAMHHKFALIDGRTLLNGSFNWTAQAADGNQENLVIFRGGGGGAPRLATAFEAEFERMWAKFAPKEEVAH